MSATLLTAMGLQLGGGILKAKAERKASLRQASLLDITADQIEQRTEFNVDLIEESGKEVLGRQRAIIAASGSGLSSGSNIDTLADTHFKIARRVAAERFQGSFDARVKRSEAGELRAGAKDAFIAGILGSLGSAASTAYKFKSASSDSPGKIGQAGGSTKPLKSLDIKENSIVGSGFNYDSFYGEFSEF